MIYSIFQLQQKNAVLAARLSGAANLATIEPNVAPNHEPLPAATSPNASLASPTSADSNSLKGKVVAADGKPIAKAKVVLAHKCWPNQKFTFENNLTETDKDGKFEFENLYSTDGNNEFLVTVFAEGHEMKSEYVSIKAKKTAGLIDFKLKPTKAIRLKVVGEDKKPMADTDVVLLSRKVGTKEHMIYPISAEDIKISTDRDGFVNVSHLTEGDVATFGVLIFSEVVQAELKVTKDDEQIITVQKKVAKSQAADSPPPQPNNLDHIDWLNQHALRIRTVDPSDTNFHDLQPLKSLIGEARIVLLGELSHGDGFALRQRIDW